MSTPFRILTLMLCWVAAALPQKPDRTARHEQATAPAPMVVHVLRLQPGEDLRRELARFASERRIHAAVIVSAVGSLKAAAIRYAGEEKIATLQQNLEVVSLSGTLDEQSIHVHLSVSDNTGRTTGGHLSEGCIVYTTMEIAIGELPGLRFLREKDPRSGYLELKIRPDPGHSSHPH